MAAVQIDERLLAGIDEFAVGIGDVVVERDDRVLCDLCNHQ